MMRLALSRSRLLFGLGLLALGGLIVQSSIAAAYEPATWDKVVAAAKKEGVVRFYTVLLPGPMERTITGFKKAYPDINVEFFRGAAGVLMPRVEQERMNGAEGCDVLLSTTVTWFGLQAKEGKLLALIGPAAQNWPAVKADGAYAIVGYQPFSIPYNTKLVKTPPESYAALLAPEFKDHLATIESASESVAAWYDWLEKTQGPNFLSRLRAQNPKLSVGGAPLSQVVASGEVSAGVFGEGGSIKALMDAGAPLNFVMPKPAFASSFAAAALGWTKHPNAAMLFMDYLMSRDGQTAWHGTGESVSPTKGIPGSADPSSVVPYDPSAYPADVVKAYDERWSRIFK